MSLYLLLVLQVGGLLTVGTTLTNKDYVCSLFACAQVLHGGFGRTLRSVAYKILPNLDHLPTIGTRTLSTEQI